MTLLEIMVVLILIGLVAGSLLFPVMGRLDRGRYKSTQNQIREVIKSLETFYLDCGTYPSEEEGLGALVEQTPNCSSWGGPYLKKIPKDSWGGELLYEFSEETGEPIIISLGRDKKAGGTKAWDKDIVSSDL